ncbi:MAG: PIN domain-containing protein [Gemmatimonadetes bacterium]|nr:PIN domain-containing protein [Gemmatimonadota bacterium]
MAGRRDILLDTGAVVAILDRTDPWHERCVAAWSGCGARCLTTEAVVTEASHLVSRGGAPCGIPLEFLLAADVRVVQLERSGHEHAVRLMRRYRDLPMDYADATLVVVADAALLRLVFTLDRRGFRSYRRRDGKTFELIP